MRSWLCLRRTVAGNILAGNSCRNYHRSRDRIKNTKRPFNLYAHLNFTRINEANLHERKVGERSSTLVTGFAGQVT